MDTRATIETIVERAYAARRNNDPAAAAACFCDDAEFSANGAPVAKSLAERAGAIKTMIEAFHLVKYHERCRIIDPPYAVVHWRGTFRAQNGNVGDTDILDVIEVRDGRIASLKSFFDTAYAVALSAPTA